MCLTFCFTWFCFSVRTTPYSPSYVLNCLEKDCRKLFSPLAFRVACCLKYCLSDSFSLLNHCLCLWEASRSFPKGSFLETSDYFCISSLGVPWVGSFRLNPCICKGSVRLSPRAGTFMPGLQGGIAMPWVGWCVRMKPSTVDV